MKSIVDMVDHQVIAAVRNEEQLKLALASKADLIFLLFGNVFTMKEMAQQTIAAGKSIFLHLDFMEGIATDRSGIQYIAQHIRPAGIITTRNHLVSVAKEAGLMAIQRLFLIDSTAIRNGMRAIHASGADAVEIMPGLMPKVINELTEMTELPIIAGGLIRQENEVMEALNAGALAVSVGSPELWNMAF